MLMTLIVVLGVWVAERWLRARPWQCGVWFGLLAVGANVCSPLTAGDAGVMLLLRDGPVLAAALFFGPVAGLVAGAIAAAESASLSLFGLGTSPYCSLSTFLVAALAASVSRWFLDRRRPSLVQAVTLALTFDTFHFVFELLLDQASIGRSCEIILNAFVPEALTFMTALAAATVAARSVGAVAHNFRSDASWILMAFVVFGAVVSHVSYNGALEDTAARGSYAKRRLKFLFNSQIDFMMHHDALQFAAAVGTLRDMTPDDVNRLITGSRYDELTVVDPKGRIRGANDQKLYAFDFSTHPQACRYLQLAAGDESYIGEPFRASGLDGICVKYGGVPLPDRSGFLQLGYKRRRMEEEFHRFFLPVFDQDIRVFESDYYIVASTNDGRIVEASRCEETLKGLTVASVGIRGDRFARVLGVWCFVETLSVGGWRIYCMLPISETYGPAAVQCGIVLLLVFAFMFLVRLVMLRFRKQRERIDQLRAEADDRLHKDMLNAQKIQQSFLPEALPSGAGFALTARMTPAREVGGDFYDAFALKDGRIVLVVADVSGKGVPAAMFMTRAKTLMQLEVVANATLADAVVRTNDRLCQQNYAEMFVTAWVGVWNPETGALSYVNAGHNPPVVRRADGSVEWIRERGGIALAAMSGVPYRVRELTLGPGDELLLYTDGVSEAMNPAGELYGEERLARYFAAAGTAVVEGLFLDLADFARGAEQSDDITALHLACKAVSGRSIS